MLSNPPYGKSWKSDLERMGGKDGIKDPRFIIEHAGDPEYSLVTRSSDGQMLFLANMLSKMKHDTKLGSRIAEVHNGSSLFTGDAGQGESNIRRWIIENDWLEAIVALPLNMFYNTGIATYIWVLTNRKPEHRRGKVQLIDATQLVQAAAQEPRQEELRAVRGGHRDASATTFLAFKETEQSKIFANDDFGYCKVTVERPLRLRGIDPERAYSPKEIKALKAERQSDEAAPPVIRKIHKRGTEPDPLHGLFEATIARQAVRRRVRARHRSARHRTGAAARSPAASTPSSRARCCPTRPTPGIDPSKHQDRLRDQLHPLLLQAAAAAHARGDPRRHPRAREGDRGLAERDRREAGTMTTGSSRIRATRTPALPWLGAGPDALGGQTHCGRLCASGARTRHRSTELLVSVTADTGVDRVRQSSTPASAIHATTI